MSSCSLQTYHPRRGEGGEAHRRFLLVDVVVLLQRRDCAVEAEPNVDLPRLGRPAGTFSWVPSRLERRAQQAKHTAERICASVWFRPCSRWLNCAMAALEKPLSASAAYRLRFDLGSMMSIVAAADTCSSAACGRDGSQWQQDVRSVDGLFAARRGGSTRRSGG